MKTITIERVSNGWIVRPFNPGTWSCVEAPAMSVFTDMAAMQAALPQFFEMPDPLVPVRRDQLGSPYTGPFGAVAAPGVKLTDNPTCT